MNSWRTAVPDWADRIRERRSLIPDLPLIAAEADRAVRMYNLLRLPDVPGQPLLEHAGGEWFRDILRALFGSYDPERGVRHLREVFVLVPKKNSKTTNGAALMLIAALMSRRPRSEFLFVAPTQEISNIAFAQAVGMVEADEVLRKKCHIQDHVKRIVYRPTGAFLKVKSFDPKVLTGSKPSGVLLDEIHVIAEAPNADRVVGQLRGGLISQPEGFLVTITTQGERPPAGVFKAELTKARAVRDGTLDASILPVLYEFPGRDDWRSVENWPQVLPNLGLSITLDRLVEEYRAADSAGSAELIRWASQHLNVEIGLSLQSDSWTGAMFWEQNGTGPKELEVLLDRCDLVTVGIDGGGLDDLLGFCIMGRCETTGDWLSWHRAFCHPVALERRKQEQPKYRDFEADGDLRICEAVGDDVHEVVELIQQCERACKLDKIGVDPAGIGSIVDAIEASGINRERVVGIPQGWRLAGATKTVERRLAAGTLRHAGTPMMAWCVGNAKIEVRTNTQLITKAASGNAKIDPLIATLNAAALMSLAPQPVDVAAMIG